MYVRMYVLYIVLCMCVFVLYVLGYYLSLSMYVCMYAALSVLPAPAVLTYNSRSQSKLHASNVLSPPSAAAVAIHTLPVPVPVPLLSANSSSSSKAAAVGVGSSAVIIAFCIAVHNALCMYCM